MLKTLDQALIVLKSFTREKSHWGVRELAKELGMNHSIVYRILATFQKHGFVRQIKETKKYGLGIPLAGYGALIREQLNLSDLVHPMMRQLSEQTGESVFVTWRDGDEGVCIEISESSQKIKYEVSVGSRTPLFTGVFNTIILAYLPPEDQETLIMEGMQSSCLKPGIHKERFLAILCSMRRKGWAYSVDDDSEGVFEIAVPIFNREGEVIASLAMAGPAYRMPEEQVEQALTLLREGRDEIQRTWHHLV